MNTLSIIFLVIGVVAICTIVFLLVTCEFIYRFAIKRNSIVSRIVEKFFYRDIDKYKMDFSWWSGKNIEKYEIKSKDGLKLVGHFVPNITNKVALVVHGYGAKAMEMQTYCKMFFDLGYSVLAVDDRGHGESEGKNITMGYHDRYDISNWVDFIISKNKHYKIVIFGLSMGAASVCLYSGLKKPRNVKAIISDCAYSNAYDILNNISVMSVVFSILPTMRVYNLYNKFRAGYKLSDVDVCQAVKKCDVPILFIHGNKDGFVPFYMRDLLYESAPKQFRHKLTIDGAGHALSLPVGQEKYIQKVTEFLKQYMH